MKLRGNRVSGLHLISQLILSCAYCIKSMNTYVCSLDILGWGSGSVKTFVEMGLGREVVTDSSSGGKNCSGAGSEEIKRLARAPL